MTIKFNFRDSISFEIELRDGTLNEKVIGVGTATPNYDRFEFFFEDIDSIPLCRFTFVGSMVEAANKVEEVYNAIKDTKELKFQICPTCKGDWQGVMRQYTKGEICTVCNKGKVSIE